MYYLVSQSPYIVIYKLDYVSRVILMICSQLKVNQTTFINENIDYLLSMWLIKNYQLAKFPWFIAASASLNDFFNDHIETLTISILRHKSEILKDFVLVIAGDSMATIIEVSWDIFYFYRINMFINTCIYLCLYSPSSPIV